MNDFARNSALMAIMHDQIGAATGSVDASNGSILVSFPSQGLGSRLDVTRKSVDAFRAAGYDVAFMNVGDQTASFQLKAA